MSNLTIKSKAVAYGDPTATGNPLRRNFDWERGIAIACTNPKAAQERVAAGASYTFFNAVRSTSIAGDTAFDVTANSALENTYRFTNSAGTAPAFRTNRALTLSGATLTVTVNLDATVRMDVAAGTWGTVAAGDNIFIPGPTTGDIGTPVDTLNEGVWVVLAVLSATAIQCARATGTDFVAVNGSYLLTTNAQVLGFTGAGVLIGDKVSISAAFAPATLKTFIVTQVTPSWFEVASTTAIPLETNKIPAATGMIFYSAAKKFVRVETDQELSIRLNGATGDFLWASPVDPADTEQVGHFELFGPVWSMTVVNKSSQVATVDLFSVE